MEATKPADEFTEAANTPVIDWDNVGEAEDVVVENSTGEVTEPVTEKVPEPAHLEDALDAQFEALMDKAPPVSKEPIKLLEPEEPLATVQVGEVTVIATAGRIDLVRQTIAPEAAKPAEPPPMPTKVFHKIQAEMEAGRNSLANHALRAQLFPRPKLTAAELEREKPPTQIINGDHHPLQHLLNKPVTPGKGGGY